MMVVFLHTIIPLFFGAGTSFLPRTFSAGSSESPQGLNAVETTLLNQTIEDGDLGALTYFWITGDAEVSQALIRIYVDGEIEPSITYQPAKASGIGVVDMTDGNGTGPNSVKPWSTKWFGQLGRYAYFNTFKVPFQKSVRLTYQCPPSICPDGSTARHLLFIQARGVSGLGAGLTEIIPGFSLPPTARLKLQVRENVNYQPLEYMPLADVATGSGAVFATSLWWNSTSKSTIEGCVRAYTPHDASFSDSMLMSTGWEDYYISSWGMIQGPWQGELSGTTQWTSPANHDVSAYRFHTQDPLFFHDGLKLVLRNGDAIGPSGKCTLETGGKPVGSPGLTKLSVYAWVYVWDDE